MESRKYLRIRNYDYSTPNYYFVTICTHNRRCIFGDVGDFNDIGKIAEMEIRKISYYHTNVRVDKYVVMPNHVHAIIVIGCDDVERSRPFPTLSTIVGLYKSGVSRQVHHFLPDVKIWQKSFYDHVIRNEREYREICKYIDENPLKWIDDEYYL